MKKIVCIAFTLLAYYGLFQVQGALPEDAAVAQDGLSQAKTATGSDNAEASEKELKSRPATSNVRGAMYPQVTDKGHAIFRLRAPEAQKVQVDLGRKYDMVKNKDGIWEVTTDPQSEGFHYYSLVIDGVSVCDPGSETFYGMSRMASGIEIPFDGDGFYAVKDVPHGELRSKRYYSSVSQTWRRFILYTPPGYDQAAEGTTYPVLYLLHGGGEDERGWATQGKTDLIMDNLIAEGKAKPMVVVMLDGNLVLPNFRENFLKLFQDDLIQCVIPFVEKNYKVKTDSKNRALAGLSMGGIQTLYVGIYHSDLFSYLGVFSSGWFQPQNDLAQSQYNFLKDNVATFKDNVKEFWFSMGGERDIAYQNCKKMLEKFDELEVPYTYRDYRGGHTWPAWRESLRDFAPVLFK